MIFFSIILLIGILATTTDLKDKKIKNSHLLLGAALGTAALIYTALFTHEDVDFHIINGLFAFVLGFLLYRFDLWRGGDAKLFALLAFLMPLPAYHLEPFPSAFSLFACSFLGGSLILLPAFLKDIVVNHKTITEELSSPAKQQGLFLGIGGMIYFSWTFFPVYYLSKITSPVVIMTAMYLIFNWTYSDKHEVKKHYVTDFLKKNIVIIAIGIIFGFVTRLWLSPGSLSLPSLAQYFTHLIVFAIISTSIHTILNHFKNYDQRLSFAPLIFLGCLLSYTPFLSTAIRIIPLLGK